jgi:hypothetical protein
MGTLVVLWVAVMHAGTWLEWRHGRSPLAWGSEWFYAEIYHEYLGWGRGAAISFAMAVILLLPPLPFVIAAVSGSLLKFLAPGLAPLSVTFAHIVERVPRGGIAIAVVLASMAATETCNSAIRRDTRATVPRQIPGPGPTPAPALHKVSCC